MRILAKSSELAYRILRPLIFRFDSEAAHEKFTKIGESLGRHSAARSFIKSALNADNAVLSQKLCGISFANPVGLAAGFDYEARLTQITPSLGFGFETVGTITNMLYEGNPPPRLGRLIKSRSLLVNKGFKNSGVKATLESLSRVKFSIPIGISIGKTNRKKPMAREESMDDIAEAFRKTENSSVPFTYYELNISCPNLYGDLNFYDPDNFRELLSAVIEAGPTKPIFIKMPIELGEKETVKLLDAAVSFHVSGVIFGNLQKNLDEPGVDQDEIKKYQRGYLSGKPTERRSNELVKFAYRSYGKQLAIIGCGGIFSAEDAYRKIKLGASLVQLITGLIFKGPQLPSQINSGLIRLLKRDGFKNITEAVGTEA